MTEILLTAGPTWINVRPHAIRLGAVRLLIPQARLGGLQPSTTYAVICSRAQPGRLSARPIAERPPLLDADDVVVGRATTLPRLALRDG